MTINAGRALLARSDKGPNVNRRPTWVAVGWSLPSLGGPLDVQTCVARLCICSFKCRHVARRARKPALVVDKPGFRRCLHRAFARRRSAALDRPRHGLDARREHVNWRAATGVECGARAGGSDTRRGQHDLLCSRWRASASLRPPCAARSLRTPHYDRRWAQRAGRALRVRSPRQHRHPALASPAADRTDGSATDLTIR
jgi:hypothetical protein